MNNADKLAIETFNKTVNMSATSLQDWLKTKKSLAVGYKTNETDESVGHLSGQHI